MNTEYTPKNIDETTLEELALFIAKGSFERGKPTSEFKIEGELNGMPFVIEFRATVRMKQ